MNFSSVNSITSDELKQVSPSDVEFLSSMELLSMWRTEGLSRVHDFPVEKVTDDLTSRETLDFALNLHYVADSGPLQNDVHGTISFQPKLFDQSTVVMIFECFKNLLAMAVENPSKVVWDLPMLMQFEEQRQLVEWNKTSSPYPKPGWLVHELFLDQVEANPNATALVEYGGLRRILSYAELRSMAEKVERQLRMLGVEGDSTVGLLMTNDSAEAIASIYGT